MSFRENLRYIMDCKGIQTKELSQQTAISENTLKSYLRTDSAEPKISKAIILAKALDVSVEYLCTGHNVSKKIDISRLEYKITDNLSKLSEKELKIVSSLIDAIISQQ